MEKQQREGNFLLFIDSIYGVPLFFNGNFDSDDDVQVEGLVGLPLRELRQPWSLVYCSILLSKLHIIVNI